MFAADVCLHRAMAACCAGREGCLWQHPRPCCHVESKLATVCRREEEIQKGVAALQKERQALEACVLSMSGKTVALERWLEENEAKLPQGE